MMKLQNLSLSFDEDGYRVELVQSTTAQGPVLQLFVWRLRDMWRAPSDLIPIEAVSTVARALSRVGPLRSS